MNVTVVDNKNEQQYEALVDGRLAVARYRRADGTILFHHTEVPPALRGRGVGSALVRFALDDARAQGLTVASQCWFVSGFIRDHPEYLALMAPPDQARVTGSGTTR